MVEIHSVGLRWYSSSSRIWTGATKLHILRQRFNTFGGDGDKRWPLKKLAVTVIIKYFYFSKVLGPFDGLSALRAKFYRALPYFFGFFFAINLVFQFFELYLFYLDFSLYFHLELRFIFYKNIFKSVLNIEKDQNLTKIEWNECVKCD